MSSHLFLFGGGPPFTKTMAKKFVQLASMKVKPVSIIFVERDGWEEYMPRYTEALQNEGANDFRYIPLPSTPMDEVIHNIRESSGIIIGGGNTNMYADYIVDTEISHAIKEKYKTGTPIAGFSAGALISPKECVISPQDNILQKFQHRPGLGLVENMVIAVHFSEWNDEEHLRNIASAFPYYQHYGIDEQSCLYCLNGMPVETDGKGVYSIFHNQITKTDKTSL